ncbi:hypothetical protein [Streptomyces aureus]|uniref:hypothetical protein n=1 Tax=Streptomyces aureus TaxID=193461 RepID=UPI00056C2D56|nr:hypothetical protein [Streptomyces aureus]
MDQSKLSARLLLAFASDVTVTTGGEPLAVYVELADVPTPEQVDHLQRAGATGVIEGRKIITARVVADEVKTLSDKPWVRAISLAEPLRTLPIESGSTVL